MVRAVHLLAETTIYLAAAVLAVPLTKRLGLGSTLGYLIAGVVIGPSTLGLISQVEDILAFSEFGVVLLLFMVGLELEPARLWEMRVSVFGGGGAQVAACTVVFGGAAWLFGLPPTQAAVIGAGLALSSTALAVQILGERHELALPHGRAAFSMLLFHDIAVIPMLAVVPMLGSGAEDSGRPAWMSALIALGAIAAVVLIGRFVLRLLLRLVASARSSEISIAAALLVVTGTALLMEDVGLSMALGAFLAGVLLADSPYRHELEANIQPFKGLLLGLFFIAVGMSARLALVAEQPWEVLGLVVGLVLVKCLVLFGVGRGSKLDNISSANLAITLSHGGVFAFVLFGVALESNVLSAEVVELLIVVIALSMAVTPVLFTLRDLGARLLPSAGREMERDGYEHAPVIIAGFGRFGQMVGRILAMKQIPFTALEADPTAVDFVKRYGGSIHFGDTSRLEILRAAKVEEAEVFVVAIEDVEASVATARIVRKTFPDVIVIARARNRRHVYELRDVGVEHIFRETLASSLEAARQTLLELDLPYTESYRAVRKFREYDERLLEEQYEIRDDDEMMIASAKQTAAELEALFSSDDAEERQ